MSKVISLDATITSLILRLREDHLCRENMKRGLKLERRIERRIEKRIEIRIERRIERRIE